VVIGGGLAGSEAAWQLARRGAGVILYEMRPAQMTPAHVSASLAELVCSNSLGSNLIDRAPGLLKEELRHLGSLVVAAADAPAVPAGERWPWIARRFPRQSRRGSSRIKG
jgi:methylenetetrahydrofolate--tRNA-(uracil-5-)-methyltransferase